MQRHSNRWRHSQRARERNGRAVERAPRSQSRGVVRVWILRGECRPEFDDNHARLVCRFGDELDRTAQGRFANDEHVEVATHTDIAAGWRCAQKISSSMLGIECDVLVLTPAEFADRGRGSSFWADVIDEAKLVYAA
jgi:hypothetical protein